MDNNSKIGIFGGTFNPIHIAHMIVADRFMNELSLDVVYFIPAFISPFKVEDQSAFELQPEHRLKMVRLSIQNNPKFQVDSFEIDSKGVSFTIDTLNHFRKRFPHAELNLLIGTDQATEFKRWKDWENIPELARICIAERPNTITEDDREKINKNMTYLNIKPNWITIPLLNISSTDIRKLRREYKSFKYLVAPEVENYILRYHLYK